MVIFFDFDGTIVNSAPAKLRAFEKMFDFLSGSQRSEALKLLRENQGIPRHVKFSRIYREIIGVELSNDALDYLSDRLSALIDYEESDIEVLGGVPRFLRENSQKASFYIVSAAPKEEIMQKLEAIGLLNLFSGIAGSETPKAKAIKYFMRIGKHSPDRALMIGDTLNDFQASIEAEVKFLGFGDSSEFVSKQIPFIRHYSELDYLFA